MRILFLIMILLFVSEVQAQAVMHPLDSFEIKPHGMYSNAILKYKSGAFFVLDEATGDVERYDAHGNLKASYPPFFSPEEMGCNGPTDAVIVGSKVYLYQYNGIFYVYDSTGTPQKRIRFHTRYGGKWFHTGDEAFENFADSWGVNGLFLMPIRLLTEESDYVQHYKQMFRSYSLGLFQMNGSRKKIKMVSTFAPYPDVYKQIDVLSYICSVDYAILNDSALVVGFPASHLMSVVNPEGQTTHMMGEIGIHIKNDHRLPGIQGWAHGDTVAEYYRFITPRYREMMYDSVSMHLYRMYTPGIQGDHADTLYKEGDLGALGTLSRSQMVYVQEYDIQNAGKLLREFQIPQGLRLLSVQNHTALALRIFPENDETFRIIRLRIQ